MARYVGLDKTSIIWVTETQPDGPAIQVPPDLSSVDDISLMRDFKFVDGCFVRKAGERQVSSMRLAVIGVWKIQCGISTYLEFLLPEMAKHISAYHVFSEYAEGQEADPNVTPCWVRGESLMELAERVKAWKPDAILIQHEYGIFPDARRWLSLMSELQGIPTFVMFHSIYNHADKTICEAAAPNVLVHTELAKRVLKEKKGIDRSVHVIPHGCHTNPGLPRLWNLYRSEHTFMQFGFGFEYKGWENSLLACKHLKDSGIDDVYFTGLFSESRFNKFLHDRYFQKLSDMIHSMGIQENVCMLRGYQSDQVLDSFFRLNKVAVFPYRDNGEHTVYGVTGAARIAMKSGIPVVTSSVPFFYDMRGVCEQVDSPEDLALAVQNLWSDPAPQLARQNDFLEQNSWANVALKYLGVMSGQDITAD